MDDIYTQLQKAGQFNALELITPEMIQYDVRLNHNIPGAGIFNALMDNNQTEEAIRWIECLQMADIPKTIK